MVSGFSILFGAGLIELWWSSWQSPGSAAWVTWLDLAAAIASVFVAAIGWRAFPRPLQATATLTLGSGLLILSAAGFAVQIAAWIAWWNLTFAMGFLLLAFTISLEIGSEENEETDLYSPNQDDERAA